MNQEPFRPTLRELARCYQAFEFYAAVHIRQLGLTLPQFDIIATLGNFGGITPKVLGEKTLITKGTLTGVIDRLEAKGLVKRVPSADDRRSQIVKLTKKGERLFQRVFPEHLAYIGKVFSAFKTEDYLRMESALRDLRSAFLAAGNGDEQ